jgi:hypothetical protein
MYKVDECSVWVCFEPGLDRFVLSSNVIMLVLLVSLFSINSPLSF